MQFKCISLFNVKLFTEPFKRVHILLQSISLISMESSLILQRNFCKINIAGVILTEHN